jgi:hypothetical protein
VSAEDPVWQGVALAIPWFGSKYPRLFTCPGTMAAVVMPFRPLTQMQGRRCYIGPRPHWPTWRPGHLCGLRLCPSIPSSHAPSPPTLASWIDASCEATEPSETEEAAAGGRAQAASKPPAKRNVAIAGCQRGRPHAGSIVQKRTCVTA